MELTGIELARPYQVEPDSCVRYRHEGHILLRGVATIAEIEHYRPLLIGLADRYARIRNVSVAPDEAMPLLEYVANAWRKSEEIREFVFAERFARIAAELMGVRSVRLYHDEVLVKEPGGSPAPWHKDHYNWPLETHHTVKMWLALVDITDDMAPIRLASGSHHAGQFPEVPPSYESDELFSQIIHDHHIPIVSHPMRAGDAVFYSGQSLHSTSANTGARRREVLTIIYFADGTHIMKVNHENRQRDLEEFLPGLLPGEPAVSPLNPILFSMDA